MTETTQLLQRWRDGDDGAVGEILALHLAWIREEARANLGPDLREKLATEDVVQDAMLDFLRNGPRFVPANTAQLRALLTRIVLNALSDQSSWFRAARRRMSREQPLASSTEYVDGAPADPAEAVVRREQEVRLRLALELLTERDRQLLVWREWEKLPFGEIGDRLGMDPEAARGATRRALERLRDTMLRLRQGDVDGALSTAAD